MRVVPLIYCSRCGRLNAVLKSNLDGYVGQIAGVDEGASRVYVIVQAVESRHVRIACNVTSSQRSR